MKPSKVIKVMATKAIQSHSGTKSCSADGAGLLLRIRERLLARFCQTAIRIPSDKEAKAAAEFGAKVARKVCAKH